MTMAMSATGEVGLSSPMAKAEQAAKPPLPSKIERNPKRLSNLGVNGLSPKLPSMAESNSSPEAKAL